MTSYISHTWEKRENNTLGGIMFGMIFCSVRIKLSMLGVMLGVSIGPTQIYASYFVAINLLGPRWYVRPEMGAPNLMNTITTIIFLWPGLIPDPVYPCNHLIWSGRQFAASCCQERASWNPHYWQ